MVDRETHNLEVGGSIPSPATNTYKSHFKWQRQRKKVKAKVKVAKKFIHGWVSFG